MAMYPTNTKLEDWLTTWLMNEVDDILYAQKKIKYIGEYAGMTYKTRAENNLPHDRATCIDFIKQHNPKAGAQFHD